MADHPALALMDAMRAALLARPRLITLLQGPHVYSVKPHGATTSFVSSELVETRDWSVKDQKAHEHFVTLEVETNDRDRKLTQDIVAEIEAALDNANLTPAGHTLINVHMVFWIIYRDRESQCFHATVRFRAMTEPANG